MSDTAADYFLKIEGIDGESVDPKHKAELQLAGWSKSVKSPLDAATGAASGQAVVSEVRFTMRVDRSYPLLLTAIFTNQLLKKMVLTCRKAGKEQYEYLKVTLTDALISNISLTGGGGDNPLPVVTFSVNFAKITEEYKSQTSKGSLGGAIVYSYDVAASSGS